MVHLHRPGKSRLLQGRYPRVKQGAGWTTTNHRCGQLGLELLDAAHQELGELLRLAIDDLANEDHRRFGGAGRGQERTEVGVSRNDGACFGEREVDDLGVGRSRCVECRGRERARRGDRSR